MKPTANTILITGGTSGIGLALAQGLAAQGNTVIIAGRRQALLDAAAKATPGLQAVALDVTDIAALPTFAADLTARFPDLNVLINNAGIMIAEDVQTAPDGTAQATITTNLTAPIALTAALLPHLLAQPSATVVNVTSGLSFVPLASTPTYSATKAALHSYTQSLRHQLRGTAVQVLELAPPAVQTDLMPGHAQNPHAMPLADYITESLGLLANPPANGELMVERVKFLRNAEATGSFDQVFAMLNPA
ncbi:short-chain dehydrogenase [Cypionkella aquatica]|uniref:Short-chain dehydrogenase n=1 Tax=Cypionkella aquatica TaxID=1756042 RepID=A0AA37TW56_9RHOB|nr:SDR family oxidoreductase [Cypionkella aquatica]GLS88753.1 short-chain dehydrogenase [Cypionkella aquatica]